MDNVHFSRRPQFKLLDRRFGQHQPTDASVHSRVDFQTAHFFRFEFSTASSDQIVVVGQLKFDAPPARVRFTHDSHGRVSLKSVLSV